MFSLVNNVEEIKSITNNSPFGVRIYSSYLAYENTLDNYTWTDGSSAVALSCGTMVICGEPEDKEELIALIKLIGADVLCDLKLCESLNLSILESGKILSKELIGEKIHIAPSLDLRLRDSHELFTGAGLNLNENQYLLETSKLIRSGQAVLAEIKAENILNAAALACYVNDTDALISAVSVREKRKSLGTQIMTLLENKLNGRRAFLFRGENENIEFYRSLSYNEVSTWAVCKIKD